MTWLQQDSWLLSLVVEAEARDVAREPAFPAASRPGGPQAHPLSGCKVKDKTAEIPFSEESVPASCEPVYLAPCEGTFRFIQESYFGGTESRARSTPTLRNGSEGHWRNVCIKERGLRLLALCDVEQIMLTINKHLMSAFCIHLINAY